MADRISPAGPKVVVKPDIDSIVRRSEGLKA